MRRVAGIAFVAALLGSVMAVALAWFGPPPRAAVIATLPVWTEVAWPFPIDPWGRGKAFRCKAADCGTELNLYLRAKIGFCDCTTGVADDEALDRMGDLVLVGEASPLGAGRPVSIAWMKGRSRAYALNGRNPNGKTVISVAFNERCDMIVATAVLGHDRPSDTEPAVIEFLNSHTVMRWAEIALGL
ncbi:MAG: hypothetical protein Q8L13_03400 [Bradyrhizobium sp.]|uniref:hypothetical protein n=1 Tax=Bradyrhizobium sp. TaxID=376 RepID=UPI002731F6F1|nr:hypothetical protein [Bradyrhizobium sp.]MDP1865378.1 hypothetical protein [Bradyrhizobium sp.]